MASTKDRWRVRALLNRLVLATGVVLVEAALLPNTSLNSLVNDTDEFSLSPFTYTIVKKLAVQRAMITSERDFLLRFRREVVTH